MGYIYTPIYGNPQVNLGHPSRMVPLKRGQLAHAGALRRDPRVVLRV